ncbi:disease resistance protein RGA2-like [Syzygium oleosum]|uniref:disease resistance protein RGA2-like n=1 Tax=Syzygium oleosum TaxID=219896 RepID=UPI0024B91A49|nr:disease resistance protein RGA2-like [Syzygium oleosum]XP_030457972.2 disease resistance protein RGA2-like [Syzygium oleosum]
MAESLLSGIAEGVLGKIASRALQEAVAIYGVENQISELRETLTAIKAVLLDAEEQQAKNHRLQVWLDRLRDVLYDAEDVLDQVECEALRKQVISRYGGTKEKVCRFFTLSNPLILRAKLSDKVKEIRERLSRISTEKDQFDLNVQSAGNDVAHTRSREMTYSFVNKSDVVGRNIDKKKIIKMLRQVDDKNLSVIPIVGLGGLGKTTLAKLVYNDDSVKEQFEIRIWVCVPEDFDLRTIVEEIIKDSTHQSLSNFGIQQLQTLGIQQLQTHLQNTIKDKKYLLVLDDVWSNDRCKWKELRDLLSVGDSESKIIVTTRNSEVASIMGSHPAYNLKGLSHDDSMALFKRWAFDEKEKQPRHDLLKIGNDIVKKSRGVPLLVKTLGSLLYTKDEAQYWEHIRDSETWDLVEAKKDIMPVLKLSYDHLPSHLKRCFLVLSLFPRGHEINSTNLAELWMALGLISPTRNKLGLKDVGVEYVKELWKRSLIQEVEELDSKFIFKVHDLVHSLAMSVAHNEYFIVGLDTAEISEGIRYVSLSSTSLEGISNFTGVPPFLRKPTSKRLRTIFFQYKVGNGVITKEFARICISKCNSLRHLDLSSGSFEELPSSICNLKQLRSLLLNDNKRLKKVPDTICELHSLLTLSFNGCLELAHLPKNMQRLVNLTYLYVTTKQKSLQENGIQYLENLHFLGLDGCENLEVLFEGTCQPTSLRKLEIVNCGRPIYVPFGALIALEFLAIIDSHLMFTQESNFPLNLHALAIKNSEQVMELLQCLEGSACTLETFSVYDCPSLTSIPEWLPNHTCLRLIRLIGCPNLSSMPQRTRSLSALKELHIIHCGELSKRCKPQIGKDWHKIAHIPRIKLDRKRVRWTDD